MIRGLVWTWLLLAFAWPSQVAAQKVLREDEVSEQAIVEALKPPRAAATEEAENGPRRRGFRPALIGATASAAMAPMQQRKASMLITFATDSAELTLSARTALDTVARALKSPDLAGTRFRIEGHADPRGDGVHNLQLSRRRADSVVDYLVHERGMPSDLLEAVGKGSSELMNRAFTAAPENRRVTIVVRQGN